MKSAAAAQIQEPRSKGPRPEEAALHTRPDPGCRGGPLRGPRLCGRVGAQDAADVGLKNQASTQYHFKNKRDLYEAVLARGVETIVGLVTRNGGRAANDTSFMDATLDPVVDYLVEHPHLPRLIQRAGIDDTRYLRPTVTRLLRPSCTPRASRSSAAANAPWTAELHVAAGFFHLIFGYFANAKLLGWVVQQDPCGQRGSSGAASSSAR